MSDDKSLERFVERIIEIQNSQNETLKEDDLKQIAIDMGMSENDWLALQKTFNAHLTRSKAFLNYKNWDDAIEEGEQAIIINPHNEEALYTLSYSYFKRWQHKRNPGDKEMAEKYADKVLHINPSHDEAIRLISSLRSQAKGPKAQTTRAYPPHPKGKFIYKVPLPNSSGILALGILSIIICGFGFVLSIIALFLSSKALQQYRMEPERYTYKSYKNVNAGKICAIIGFATSVIYIISVIVSSI